MYFVKYEGMPSYTLTNFKEEGWCRHFVCIFGVMYMLGQRSPVGSACGERGALWKSLQQFFVSLIYSFISVYSTMWHIKTHWNAVFDFRRTWTLKIFDSSANLYNSDPTGTFLKWRCLSDFPWYPCVVYFFLKTASATTTKTSAICDRMWIVI